MNRKIKHALFGLGYCDGCSEYHNLTFKDLCRHLKNLAVDLRWILKRGKVK